MLVSSPFPPASPCLVLSCLLVPSLLLRVGVCVHACDHPPPATHCRARIAAQGTGEGCVLHTYNLVRTHVCKCEYSRVGVHLPACLPAWIHTYIHTCIPSYRTALVCARAMRYEGWTGDGGWGVAAEWLGVAWMREMRRYVQGHDVRSTGCDEVQM